MQLRSVNTEFSTVSPAAGVQWTYTFPATAGYRYKIKYIMLRFVTSAVAGNRRMNLGISTAGARGLDRPQTTTTQPASQTYYYLISPKPFPGFAIVNDNLTLPMHPDMWVEPSGVVGTQIAGMDAGDQITVWGFCVESWY